MEWYSWFRGWGQHQVLLIRHSVCPGSYGLSVNSNESFAGVFCSALRNSFRSQCRSVVEGQVGVACINEKILNAWFIWSKVKTDLQWRGRSQWQQPCRSHTCATPRSPEIWKSKTIPRGTHYCKDINLLSYEKSNYSRHRLIKMT